MRAADRRTDPGVDGPPPDPPVTCDVCGGPTRDVRCKIICLRCGYTRDCSDP